MRSKLLDQFKYSADLTSATDRTGFDSAVFIAIGGTATTAVAVLGDAKIDPSA